MLVPNPSRKTTTRARTGCTTCKARHVKCDETKPGCLRCIKFWGVCEGYGPDSSKTKKRKGSSGHGVVVPRMAPIRFVLAKYPTNAISKSETEDRYFQFFCNQTASTLSGYFKSELWNRLILQMGPREEFVRHAIIAIAALDKTMEVARKVAGISAGVKALPTTSVSDANTHHQMALKHYGKALKLMRMADPNDAHYLRNTLIGCLVTSCFESFHGNQESALIQTQAGINILFGFRDPLRITKRQRLNRTLIVDAEIEDELIDMFNRLDFQILTFRDRRTVDQHDLVFNEAMDFLSEMPAAFRDLAEARMYLDVAGNATMHWRARVAFTNPPLTTFSFQTTNDANYNIPPSSILTADQLKAGHAALFKMALGIHDAFVPVFQTSRVKRADGSYPPEYAGATVMMLVMIIGRFSIPSDQSDLMYDQFLPDFKYVLSLCKEILEYEGRSAKPVFHFDIVGVVTALFMTATRCRDRIVRRQAVILLQKYPRREGLWDSAMACTLAAWFIDAEEHELEGDFVPEERRLRVVSNDFNLSKRRALVKCSKKAPDSQERVMMADVLLTW